MNRVSDNIKRSRIKNELASRIERGEFPFGSRFPGINDLIREYAVSYVTVNKALKLLAGEGYLRCRPGVGYFVCYAEPEARASKELNIISTPGYYRSHKADLDFGIDQFRKRGWTVRLLLGDDLYEFTEQLNSPSAYSIITAFNVNWDRFSATFRHMVCRTLVLGRLSGDPQITSIVCDEYETIRQAMAYFASVNRRKVALVCALPQSELESLRIAAWRNMALASGLSLDWVRRHLLSLDLETQPDDPEREADIYRKWLAECAKDTEAVILPSASSLFPKVCRACGIRIPDELAVLSIGLSSRPMKGVAYLDHNYRGHVEYALDILEDRYRSNRVAPGSWYFCSPKGIREK